ncbi:transcriptional regulator [Pseudonocardia sp. P1]
MPDGDVNRREALRIMSLAGALLTLPGGSDLDVERLTTPHTGALGSATLDEFGRLNDRLWREFSQASAKSDVLPAVRRRLDVLTGLLREPRSAPIQRRLCALTADLFQLCGEIFFDLGAYGDAAQSYALAAGAGREAEEFDLWACAMVRHAFVDVYEHRPGDARPLLEGAAGLARRGDPSLPTRHWVAAVQAQAYAELGDEYRCQGSLDDAALVRDRDPAATTGWLRFSSDRLAEERGSCFVRLGLPDRAEPALLDALRRSVSIRRRGALLSDLAMVGAQRGDAEYTVLYGSAAVDASRRSASTGYVGRRLHTLRPHLRALLGDRHVRHLDHQISLLTST